MRFDVKYQNGRTRAMAVGSTWLLPDFFKPGTYEVPLRLLSPAESFKDTYRCICNQRLVCGRLEEIF